MPTTNDMNINSIRSMSICQVFSPTFGVVGDGACYGKYTSQPMDWGWDLNLGLGVWCPSFLSHLVGGFNYVWNFHPRSLGK